MSFASLSGRQQLRQTPQPLLQVLHAILAQITQSQRDALANLRQAGGLGNRQQQHLLGPPPSACAGFRDALAHLVNPARQCRLSLHVGSRL